MVMTKVAFENVIFAIKDNAVVDFEELLFNCQYVGMSYQQKMQLVAEMIHRVTLRKNNVLHVEDIQALKKEFQY
jgi:hypothetical protein